jgi:large subunit ribosomal protein L4e
MKKAHIYSKAGEKTAAKIDMPSQFSEPLRSDVIARAVISAEKNDRQPYGPDPKAGKRSSARYKGTRKGWGHSYGYGQARIPRLMLKKGGRRVGQAKVAPQTLGGRAVHAPTPEKNLTERINRKERLLAIRSAIAATAEWEIVSARGHRIPKELELPLIVETGAEEISKAGEIETLFQKLGLGADLARAAQRKTRPGVGKMRGRPYKAKRSVLLILSNPAAPALRAARNIPGVDAVSVNQLNARLLAPGAKAGRLAVWSEAAISKLKEEKLYNNG